MRLRSLLVIVACLAAHPSGAGASPAPLELCAARKFALLAGTCARVLDGRPVAASRLARGWARAERIAARRGADCVSPTSTAADAAARLAATVEALDAAPTQPDRCRAALRRLVGRACERSLAIESLVARTGNTAVRSEKLARLARRVGARWPRHGCAAMPDAVVATAREVAAGAAGDATTRSLRALAGEAGIAIGAAVDAARFASDADYVSTLEGEFGSVTPENVMKWGPIHPEPDTYAFGPADTLVDFAAGHGMRVRGTTLLWGRLQLPDYVLNAAGEAELRALVTEHIATVVPRYAGRVAGWDVVNEPLTFFGEAGTTDGLDDNVFLQRLGPGYVAEALELAHAADPAARLYINDFFVETKSPKQDRLFRLARDLLAAGAPLHGVGLQCHFGTFSGVIPSRAELTATIERFAALGLEVELTELDVGILQLAGDEPSRLAMQREAFRNAFAACLAVPACRGITTWGVGDDSSWLRTFLGLQESPLLFGDALERKPAYFGARAAFFDDLARPR